MPGGKRMLMYVVTLAVMAWKPEVAPYIAGLATVLLGGETLRPHGTRGLLGAGDEGAPDA